MDAHPVSTPDDRNTLFNQHIRGLRTNPWTKDAWLILMAENKLGHESGCAKELLDNFKTRIAAYHQPKSAKALKPGKGALSQEYFQYKLEAESNPGFLTDPRMKAVALERLRRCLAHNILLYFDGCVCTNPFLIKHRNDMERFISYKEDLEDQMKRAKEFPMSILSRDTQRVKYTWSAKTNNDGEVQDGYNDDLLVMLAFACYLWPEAMAFRGSLPGFPYDEINWNDNDDYEDD